jgi:hypothetical protein
MRNWTLILVWLGGAAIGASVALAVTTHQTRTALESVSAADAAAARDQAAALQARFDRELAAQVQLRYKAEDSLDACGKAAKNAADLDAFSAQQFTLLYEPEPGLAAGGLARGIAGLDPRLRILLKIASGGEAPPQNSDTGTLRWVLYRRPGEKFMRALIVPKGGRVVSSALAGVFEGAQ